jgi:hypothetical protein
MALADLMELNRTKNITKKVGLSEERIKEVLPIIKQYVSF